MPLITINITGGKRTCLGSVSPNLPDMQQEVRLCRLASNSQPPPKGVFFRRNRLNSSRALRPLQPEVGSYQWETNIQAPRRGVVTPSKYWTDVSCFCVPTHDASRSRYMQTVHTQPAFIQGFNRKSGHVNRPQTASPPYRRVVFRCNLHKHHLRRMPLEKGCQVIPSGDKTPASTQGSRLRLQVSA